MESCILDLEDILEGVSLLFDGSFIVGIDTSSPSLEIHVLDSSPSLGLPHFIAQLDDVIDSLSLEMPIQSLKIHTWRPRPFIWMSVSL